MNDTVGQMLLILRADKINIDVHCFHEVLAFFNKLSATPVTQSPLFSPVEVNLGHFGVIIFHFWRTIDPMILKLPFEVSVYIA